MEIQTEPAIDLARGDRGGMANQRRQSPDASPLGNLITLYRPRLGGFLMLGAYILVMLLIYAGWQQRLEWPLTAESGTGYALGIIGGSLMLMLLLYPLRKHSRFMNRLGPVKYWFRTHMLFGVLGPVCILFHCGFQLGSTNSNAALFCMIIVASSGLVGRYFYTRIHHGLYGQKASLEDLQKDSIRLGESLGERLKPLPRVLERLRNFEARVSTRSGNLLGSLWTLLSLGLRTWFLYLSFSLSIRGQQAVSRSARKQLARHIGAHLASIRKLAEFHFYERLFSIWHVVHFPLFLMLVLSGIVHVIAVHMY